jgi:uncharacterized protein RhaS with RHS repeats
MKGMNMKMKLQFVAVLMLVLCGTTQSFAHYNPSTGRWLSRDAFEEQGGLNLYGFVGNDSNDRADAFGMMTWNAVQAIYNDRKARIDAADITCGCFCGEREAIHKYSISGGVFTPTMVYADTPWRDCDGECCGPFNTTYFWWDCYSSAAEGGGQAGDMSYGWSEGDVNYFKPAKPPLAGC